MIIITMKVREISRSFWLTVCNGDGMASLEEKWTESCQGYNLLSIARKGKNGIAGD